MESQMNAIQTGGDSRTPTAQILSGGADKVAYENGCCVCGTNIDTGGIFEPVWCGDCADRKVGMTPAMMAAMDAEIDRQRKWTRRARGLEA